VGQTRISVDKGYCIDASSLMELDSYPPDIFPKLWEDLDALVKQGLLTSPLEIYNEIGRRYTGPVQIWTKKHKTMFLDIDGDQYKEAMALGRKFQGLVDYNKPKDDADPFLIALAKCRGYWTVVTQEKHNDNKFKPHIPDICEKIGIKCIDLFGFFRELNWKY